MLHTLYGEWQDVKDKYEKRDGPKPEQCTVMISFLPGAVNDDDKFRTWCISHGAIEKEIFSATMCRDMSQLVKAADDYRTTDLALKDAEVEYKLPATTGVHKHAYRQGFGDG